MPQELASFAITIANTYTPSAPLNAALPIPPSTVRKIKVRVPPGPRGQVGFAIATDNVAIFPQSRLPTTNTYTQNWIVADSEMFEFEPVNASNAGTWQLLAYNTGTYSHTLYVMVEYDVAQEKNTAAALRDTTAINSSSGSITIGSNDGSPPTPAAPTPPAGVRPSTIPPNLATPQTPLISESVQADVNTPAK